MKTRLVNYTRVYLCRWPADTLHLIQCHKTAHRTHAGQFQSVQNTQRSASFICHAEHKAELEFSGPMLRCDGPGIMAPHDPRATPHGELAASWTHQHIAAAHERTESVAARRANANAQIPSTQADSLSKCHSCLIQRRFGGLGGAASGRAGRAKNKTTDTAYSRQATRFGINQSTASAVSHSDNGCRVPFAFDTKTSMRLHIDNSRKRARTLSS